MKILTRISSKLIVSFALFLSIQSTNVSFAQCSAGTEADFSACLTSIATSGGSITLTAVITLTSALTIPNKSFTLIVNGFDLVINGQTLTLQGTPEMTVQGAKGSIIIIKNGSGPTFAALATSGGVNAYAASLSIVLGVGFGSFTAVLNDNTTLLSWTTTAEINAAYFDIERSADGQNFNSIGTVKSENKPNTYTFTDIRPLFANYYRLKEVAANGKETTSKIISIGSSKVHKLKIYPSLVTDGQLTVETTGDKSDFLIVNLLGQQVTAGKIERQINVSALSRGVYLLIVGTEKARFVKQ